MKYFSIIFDEFIDEIMNNVMIEEQNNNNTKMKNEKLDFTLSKEKRKDFFDDYIPSKSINNKQIKLDNNPFNENSFFEEKKLTKKNETEGCKLCVQINKLNIEHKKYLIDYLNKLNEFILKE